jgi:hypothetical protein
LLFGAGALGVGGPAPTVGVGDVERALGVEMGVPARFVESAAMPIAQQYESLLVRRAGG